MSLTKSKRHLFRFRLRSLLLCMLLACVVLGWNVELARKQHEAVAWAQEMGLWVTYDYQVADDLSVAVNAAPPGPEWLHKQLGVDFVNHVVSVHTRGKDVRDVSMLAKLSRLEMLTLWGTRVSDVTPLAGLTRLNHLSLEGTQVRDLSPLAELTRLEKLSLSGTEVSDVTQLADLTQLEVLSLAGTRVSDVTPLVNLTQLKFLVLNGTRVSDVAPLAGLKRLQWLALEGTPVSEQGLEQLRKELPGCQIQTRP